MTVRCNDMLVIATDTRGWQAPDDTPRWFKALVFPAMERERSSKSKVCETNQTQA